MAANVVPIRPTVAIGRKEANPRQHQALPPIPPVPAELSHALGHRTALYLIIGMSLSRTAKGTGGEFYLPETGSPDPGGNYFRRLGSWQSRGCGAPATQRAIRRFLVEEKGLLEVRRAGLPARLYYRFRLAECQQFLVELGCGSEPAAAAHVQPTGPAAKKSAPLPSQPKPPSDHAPKPEHISSESEIAKFSEQQAADSMRKPKTMEDVEAADPPAAQYIKDRIQREDTRDPQRLMKKLVELWGNGNLKLPSSNRGHNHYSGAGRMAALKYELPLSEIERLAHPGESYEQAAARIARQEHRDSSHE